jgi:hypothetical protein
MAQSWFFYYQVEGGEDSWRAGAASDRAAIVERHQPRYCTVLDVDTNFDGDITREDQLKARYRGDLYIDIDVSVDMGGIGVAIQRVNEVLDKYEKVGAKISSFRIFASGSKGFHIEIPIESCLKEVNKTGYSKLPQIFKEMVHLPELYVDNIDPRVYSSQRGRMWRTTNVQRENGKHKVQISLAECRGLTVEQYEEFVSAPRPILTVTEPEYCSDLGVAFMKAYDSVERKLKAVLKTKLSPEQLSRWKKKPPVELRRLMGGQVKEGAGFHPIAVQLAIAATSFGWTAEMLIERCQELIQNHQGDGNRYDTPGKRERELIRMCHYYEGGSGVYYDFALAPIRSLLDIPEEDPDEEPGEEGDPGYSETDMYPDAADADDEDMMNPLLTSGVKIRRNGLYKTIEGNDTKASAIGFDDVWSMVDQASGEVIGYQADMYLDNRKRGKKVITMSNFASRQSFQGFALSQGGASVHLTDSQVVGMAEIFRQKSAKLGKAIKMLGREGMDFILQPDGSVHAVYISHEEAFIGTEGAKGQDYRLKPAGRDCSPLESDLMRAPNLLGTDEEREFLDNLFRINKNDNVGKLLGWFSSAFYSQAIRILRRQYPLLHVYGTAGAGKSQTCLLMLNMHYYKKQTELSMATSLTPHAMKTKLSSSASIPIVWDEVKFHEMRSDVKNNITQYLRNNYIAAISEMGIVKRDNGMSQLDLQKHTNAAPLAFIGETMETETAIADRYVGVGLTKQERNGAAGQAAFNHCMRNRSILASIGKTLVSDALVLNMKEVDKEIAAHEVTVGALIPGRSTDESRRIFNYAVTMFGLDRFLKVVDIAFPGEYNEIIDTLKDAVLANIASELPKNMSESSKVLDTIAFLTKKETDDDYRLIFGTDYTVLGTNVDIKLQNSFNKYLRYSRAHGQAPLFPSYDRFVAAMKKHPATIDVLCMDNESLKDSSRVDVFRFDTDTLDTEGVDVFRS